MNILGISAFYHDAAACLVRDGQVVAAAQEERFTRKKGDQGFPANSIYYCLREARIRSPRELDLVAFYEWPTLRFERILATFLRNAPRGFTTFRRAMPGWVRWKLRIADIVEQQLGFEGPVLCIEHHESHAASAFFPSPFREAAILTLDAVGEWATATRGIGSGNRIELSHELRYPNSLGMLYSAFTYYLGFKVNSGEYKVMGLAPYGVPRYANAILTELLDLRQDGSFELDRRYFDFETGLRMTSEAFHRLLGGPPRPPSAPIEQRHMDLARSIQEVTNEIMLRMARDIRRTTGQTQLCLAGGVALNCVANGLIAKEGIFERIWIQPAAGDAGGSLGAALYAWFQHLGNERRADGVTDLMHGALLGPEHDDREIGVFLTEHSLPNRRLSAEALPDAVADLLAGGAIVAWFQGRMEFGPRALGARSILGDPRRSDMQTTMNLKIKFRESFRPFAPTVLEEDAAEYFDLTQASPYMLLIGNVSALHSRPASADDDGLFGIEKLKRVRSDIPAVTHVDHSARVQTLSRDANPLFYDTIARFKERTGCPVLINTSLNVRGEPICSSPEDALRCFLGSDIDYLVLGSYLIAKRDVADLSDTSWRLRFEPD